MFRSSRGQQQSSLRAALQGFTGWRFVCKLHNAFPGGSTAVICHNNRSFHRPKLRKRLEVESSSRIIYSEVNTESLVVKYLIVMHVTVEGISDTGPLHLFQQLIGNDRQQVPHCEGSAVCGKADPDWTIIQDCPIQFSLSNLCQRPSFLESNDDTKMKDVKLVAWKLHL